MAFRNQSFKPPRNTANRFRNKKLPMFLALLLVILGISTYLWYMNYGPFQGEKVAGVPDGHIKIIDEPMGVASLLFSAHGSYAFNFQGKGVAVYLAYYEKDVRIKHERVSGFQQTEDGPLNGTLQWGITFEQDAGQLEELRVSIRASGSQATNSYDMSQLNFNTENGFSSVMNLFSNGRIEKGDRYVLQTWQTSGMVRADNDVFHEEVLRESEQTIILYMVFE